MGDHDRDRGDNATSPARTRSRSRSPPLEAPAGPVRVVRPIPDRDDPNRRRPASDPRDQEQIAASNPPMETEAADAAAGAAGDSTRASSTPDVPQQGSSARRPQQHVSRAAEYRMRVDKAQRQLNKKK